MEFALLIPGLHLYDVDNLLSNPCLLINSSLGENLGFIRIVNNLALEIQSIFPLFQLITQRTLQYPVGKL